MPTEKVNIGILSEYEDVLIGKRANFSSMYFSEKKNNNVALSLLDHVFRNMLEWSPKDVRDHITPELLSRLHLKRVVTSLDFPNELQKTKDLWYLAHLLYPENIDYNRTKYLLSIYSAVLSGKKSKFPKNFFGGSDAEFIVALCFNEAINKKCPNYSLKELYALFTDPVKADKFLTKAKLKQSYIYYYDSPFELLHESVPDSSLNNFFYEYTVFRKALEAKNLSDTVSPDHLKFYKADCGLLLSMKRRFIQAFNKTLTLQVNDPRLKSRT